MRATVMHGAGDACVEDVPDPASRAHRRGDPQADGTSGPRAMSERESLKVMVEP